jgi:hypothetical protein
LSLGPSANRKTHRQKDGTSHKTIVTIRESHFQQCFGCFYTGRGRQDAGDTSLS